MAKMVIMYEKPKDTEKFDEHYFNIHVPLGRKIPNIIKDSVHRVVDTQNTDLNLYLITVLEFENLEKLLEAFASPEARQAEEDGPNLFQYLDKPPIITILD
ncbi:EthD family reductase [Ornithinibacillus californiensis]|uniref:EthD family reductase n=1 Tax=Ornithinibacillus californiensis TaxID=161536 RepID=UPI00064D893E|nr:EthD family reductase [Ornithinibacillus californiensis]